MQVLSPIFQVEYCDLYDGFLPFDVVNSNQSALDVACNLKKRLNLLYDECDLLLNTDARTHRSSEEFASAPSTELPIEREPKIRNYLRHAFPLSIIEGCRKDKAELIVLNNYIDVVYRPWDHTFDFNNKHYMYWKEIDCCRITREIIDLNHIDLVQLIANNIKLGYYADINMDAYYIPGKTGYMNYHNTHCILIFGFDDTKNTFSALSYNDNFQYEVFQIPYSNLLDSCSNAFFYGVYFLKLNAESIIRYDPELLQKKLINFCNSRTTYDASFYHTYDVNQYYGYMACKKYAEQIKKIGESSETIPVIELYSFLEHKKCIAWCLNYISSREHIDCAYFSEYENKTLSIVQKVLTLGMKYNFQKKTNDR